MPGRLVEAYVEADLVPDKDSTVLCSGPDLKPRIFRATLEDIAAQTLLICGVAAIQDSEGLPGATNIVDEESCGMALVDD
jgi:hypothetical protein